MKIEYAAWTDPGRQRSRNEDSSLLDSFNGVFAVFDGMGGGGTGDIASQTASDAIAEFGNPAFPKKSPFLEPLLVQAIQHAHQAVVAAQSPSGPYRYAQFGTTVAAVQIAGELVSIAHVGDARVYRLSRGTLRLCTEDHSLLNDYLKVNALTPEQIRDFPHKGIITRTLGFKGDPVVVDTSTLVPESGDLFLVCTDGVHSLLDDASIKLTLENQLGLAPDNLEEAAHSLVRAANAAGGTDNITVVLVRVTE
jgi:protein phosphatase